MEGDDDNVAAKFGLPPGFRFVPKDEEVAAAYLLPRILGQPYPTGVILEADPLSEPPWALVKTEEQRDVGAFFFAEGQPMSAKGSRQRRVCIGGGTWKGQGKAKRPEGKAAEAAKNKLSVPLQDDGAVEIEWEKYALNFHEDGVNGSSGWVMHEYAITAPPRLAASLTRVYRIRFSGHGKHANLKRKRDAQAQQRGGHGEGEDVPGTSGGAAQFAAMDEGDAGALDVVGDEEYQLSAPQTEETTTGYFPVVPMDDAVHGDPASAGTDAAGAAGNAVFPTMPQSSDQYLSALLDDGNCNPVFSLSDFIDFDPKPEL